MLVFAAILPFFLALLCLLLSRQVPTRLLGSAAAAALLLDGLALVGVQARGGLPLLLLDHSWVVLEDRTISATLQLDALNWAPVLLVLLGGGLALLALALALPPSLRGFGGLFAATQLALLAIAAGLADQSGQFLPFFWATAALLTVLALRASGALSGSDAPAIVLLAGLFGAILALAAALLSVAAQPGTPLMQAALACWVLLGVLALGAPPLHAPLEELLGAPAALAGALATLGLPLLGGYTLIRAFVPLGAQITPPWHVALTILGLLTLFICAAAAVRATHVRALLGWQWSAQMGLLLIALGLGSAASPAIALALLLNASMSTLAALLAVSVLERRTGTDELAAINVRAPLALPGLVFLLGAASAIGLPGTWGLWPRRWLIDELLRTTPWAVAPLLAGTALSALGFVAPLAAFQRASGPARTDEGASAIRSRRLVGDAVVGAVAAAPLLILGVAPQLAWRGWLAQLPSLAGATLAQPDTLTQLLCSLAALGLLGLAALARFGVVRPYSAGNSAPAGVLAPEALGESLSGLAWLGMARAAFAAAWAALLRALHLLRRGLALLEQRYYLAGLVIAVIVVLMLFIQ